MAMSSSSSGGFRSLRRERGLLSTWEAPLARCSVLLPVSYMCSLQATDRKDRCFAAYGQSVHGIRQTTKTQATIKLVLPRKVAKKHQTHALKAVCTCGQTQSLSYTAAFGRASPRICVRCISLRADGSKASRRCNVVLLSHINRSPTCQ